MIAIITLKDFLLMSKLPNVGSLLYKETESKIILYLLDKPVIFKAVYEKPEAEREGMNIAVADFKDKYLKNALRVIEIIGDTQEKKKQEEEKDEVQEDAGMPKNLEYQKDADVVKQAEAE